MHCLSQLNLHVNLTKSSSKLGCRLIDCCQPNSLQGTRQLLANRVSSPGPTSSLPSYARLLSTSDRRSSPARPEIRTRISHPTPDTSEAIRSTQRHEAVTRAVTRAAQRAVRVRASRALSCRPSTPQQARAIKRPSRALSPAAHRLLLIGILDDDPRRRRLQVREPLLGQIDG